MIDGQEIQAQPPKDIPAKKEYKKWGRLNTALGIMSLASAFSYFSAIGYDIATHDNSDSRAAATLDLSDDIQPDEIEGYTYKGIENYRPDAIQKFYRENKDSIDSFERLSPEEKKQRLIESFKQDIAVTGNGDTNNATPAVAASFATLLSTGLAASSSELARGAKIDKQEIKPSAIQAKPSTT